MQTRFEDRVLTVPEVAERLRLTSDTVYLLLAAGELPGVKFGGNWRVLSSKLEAFLAGGAK